MFCQQNLPDDGEAVDNKLCSPVCLHACIYVYIHTHMCTYVCLCLCLINGSSYLVYFVCLSICPSTALPIYLSSYLRICLSNYLSLPLSFRHAYIHTCTSLSLSLPLSPFCCTDIIQPSTATKWHSPSLHGSSGQQNHKGSVYALQNPYTRRPCFSEPCKQQKTTITLNPRP